MGLKFGIYSTPWRGSYEGHIGSYCDNKDGTYDFITSGTHNEFFRIGTDDHSWGTLRKANFKHGQYSFVKQDVQQWSEWGVDYLKYDWNPVDVPHVEEMSNALKASGRDIVFSLSNSADIHKAADFARLSTAWRTTGDITDSWKSVSSIGFKQDAWAPFCGPGHYNDPDMLVVGQVGWGHPHASRLTSAEQYTHMSLWVLLSAPLLIGCDLAKLDDFTLGLLSNDEVLEVDQDSLCKQATQIAENGECKIIAKPLEDGSWAVGLFNLGTEPATVTVKWSDLKLSGSHRVRDLWRQKDAGVFQNEYSAPIEPHGAVLIRVF